MKIVPFFIGAIGGSMGGVTAAHNSGGTYLRRKAPVTNPNTARQQLVRSLMGGAVQAWSTNLTESERQAWRDYAANVPVTDTLGETITLSGINMYVRTYIAHNQMLLAAADTEPDSKATAPVIFNTGEGIVDVAFFRADFTTPPGTLEIRGVLAAPASAAGIMVLYIAPPQTAGTRFYKGPYQIAASTSFTANAELATITADLGEASQWHSSTTPVPAWDELYVPVRLVNQYADGRISQEWRSLVQFSDETT